MNTATQNSIANYTGSGWQGKNYNKHLGIVEISKLIKTDLKKKYPECHFSVVTKKFAGGGSISISLMSAPFEPFDNNIERMKNSDFFRQESIEERIKKFKEIHAGGYAQLNQYALNRNDFENGCNGTLLTKQCYEIMKYVYRLSNSFNYDDSDSMIDYFNTNYYLHLNIGKWDKPFRVIK